MRRSWPSVLAVVGLALASCGTSSSSSKTIAYLRSVPSTGDGQDPIQRELAVAGFRIGSSLTILAADPAEAHPTIESATAAVRSWLNRGVDLIIAMSSLGAQVARDVAPETPIVFLVNDPVSAGLVRNEDRPEGLSTGVTFRVPADRTLDLARRAIPGLDSIGVLFAEGDPASLPHRDRIVEAGRRLGISVVAEAVTGSADTARAVDRLIDGGAGAVMLANSPTLVRQLDEIERVTKARRIPVIANVSLARFAIVSISPDIDVLLRQMGRQAARILRGDDPSEIPVEDPERYVVTLNRKVATTLGIPLPVDLIREASEVIDS